VATAYRAATQSGRQKLDLLVNLHLREVTRFRHHVRMVVVGVRVAAGAKYLVSRDNDLLDLMKDDDFRARYPDLLILEPFAFLREIAGAVP
jgi:predicted nucleic acid-binding protein